LIGKIFTGDQSSSKRRPALRHISSIGIILIGEFRRIEEYRLDLPPVKGPAGESRDGPTGILDVHVLQEDLGGARPGARDDDVLQGAEGRALVARVLEYVLVLGVVDEILGGEHLLQLDHGGGRGGSDLDGRRDDGGRDGVGLLLLLHLPSSHVVQLQFAAHELREYVLPIPVGREHAGVLARPTDAKLRP